MKARSFISACWGGQTCIQGESLQQQPGSYCSRDAHQLQAYAAPKEEHEQADASRADARAKSLIEQGEKAAAEILPDCISSSSNVEQLAGFTSNNGASAPNPTPRRSLAGHFPLVTAHDVCAGSVEPFSGTCLLRIAMSVSSSDPFSRAYPSLSRALALSQPSPRHWQPISSPSGIKMRASKTRHSRSSIDAAQRLDVLCADELCKVSTSHPSATPLVWAGHGCSTSTLPAQEQRRVACGLQQHVWHLALLRRPSTPSM